MFGNCKTDGVGVAEPVEEAGDEADEEDVDPEEVGAVLLALGAEEVEDVDAPVPVSGGVEVRVTPYEIIVRRSTILSSFLTYNSGAKLTGKSLGGSSILSVASVDYTLCSGLDVLGVGAQAVVVTRGASKQVLWAENAVLRAV